MPNNGAGHLDLWSPCRSRVGRADRPAWQARMIVSDNGTALTSAGMVRLDRHRVALHRDAVHESERRPGRDRAWVEDNNRERPHSSLGYATLAAFAAELDKQWAK